MCCILLLLKNHFSLEQKYVTLQPYFFSVTQYKENSELQESEKAPSSIDNCFCLQIINCFFLKSRLHSHKAEICPRTLRIRCQLCLHNNTFTKSMLIPQICIYNNFTGIQHINYISCICSLNLIIREQGVSTSNGISTEKMFIFKTMAAKTSKQTVFQRKHIAQLCDFLLVV